MRTEFVWKPEVKKPLEIPKCKWDVTLNGSKIDDV